MLITKEIIEKVQADDWEIECESPLEIRHNVTGSFATGTAAEIVIEQILEWSEDDK